MKKLSWALDLFWRFRLAARKRGVSRIRIQQIYQSAMDLIVEAGAEFDREDFHWMAKGNELFNEPDNPGSWWWGATSIERWYRLAAESDNTSAAQAIELYCGRKPFIFQHESGCGGRSRMGRLAVDSRFDWNRARLKVTSFKDSEDALIACEYAGIPGGYSLRLIRRHTITRKQLLAARKVRGS